MSASVRAFIVEDNPTILENLVGTLRELAHVESVGTANTETDGMRWLAEHDSEWDLAIVDLFLKHGTGLRILEATQNRQPMQKLVVLSNHATADMRERCTALGADAVFDKATEIDDLIDFCLRRRELAQTAAH